MTERATPKYGRMTEAEIAERRAQNVREEAERQARTAQLRLAEKPILTELRAAGFDMPSVWQRPRDAVRPWSDALPIVIKHLERGGYPDRVMEGLGTVMSPP
jgi:predicted transcriptional regulator